MIDVSFVHSQKETVQSQLLLGHERCVSCSSHCRASAGEQAAADVAQQLSLQKCNF